MALNTTSLKKHDDHNEHVWAYIMQDYKDHVFRGALKYTPNNGEPQESFKVNTLDEDYQEYLMQCSRSV